MDCLYSFMDKTHVLCWSVWFWCSACSILWYHFSQWFEKASFGITKTICFDVCIVISFIPSRNIFVINIFTNHSMPLKSNRCNSYNGISLDKVTECISLLGTIASDISDVCNTWLQSWIASDISDVCNTWLQSWITIPYETKRLHGSCFDRACKDKYKVLFL